MSPAMRPLEPGRHLLPKTRLPTSWRPHKTIRPSAAAASALIACVIAAAWLLALDLRDSTIRNIERDLRGLTMLEAEQADRTLLAVEVAAGELGARLSASSPVAREGFARRAAESAFGERLNASVSGLPQVVAIGIVDGRGRLLSASRDWPAADADVSGRPFFRRLAATAATRTTAIAPVREAGGVAMMFYISCKVLGEDGETLGYVLGLVDMRYFERLYASVAPTEADVISMVAADRTMLARHPSPPGAIGRIVPPIPGLRRSPGDPEGSGTARMTTPIDGRDRFIAVRPLDHYPLIVGASRTVEAALVAWRRQTVSVAVAVAMSVAAVAMFLGSNALRARDRALLAEAEAARSAAEMRAETSHRLAHHDALTGLPNRLLLDDAVQRLQAIPDEGRHAAFLLLDLDGFKQVNDVHGHLRGDALLKAVAGRLRQASDDGDLLARLGGDEFAIVSGLGAPASAERQVARAVALADRIVAALRMPFSVDGISLTIGTSIGIVDVGDAGRGLESLLQDADIALYRAKRMGRGTWCVFGAEPAQGPHACWTPRPDPVECTA